LGVYRSFICSDNFDAAIEHFSNQTGRLAGLEGLADHFLSTGLRERFLLASLLLVSRSSMVVQRSIFIRSLILVDGGCLGQWTKCPKTRAGPNEGQRQEDDGA